ncbi:MAG: isochorismatase family protein, partial [Burkholderiaceae bacterium]|nr:isochorismatase family protein [Burkholderiaceae bacterium]
TLAATLQALGVKELLVCGMMTQNCVVFTAISPQTQGYEVSILPECCTTVSEMLHRIALAGVATRMTLAASF